MQSKLKIVTVIFSIIILISLIIYKFTSRDVNTHNSAEFIDCSGLYKLKLNKISDIYLKDKNNLIGYYFDVCFDKNDNIYIPDYKTSNIKVFDKDGNFIRVIGRRGQGPGEFIELSGICLDDSGNIFTVDPTLKRVSVFDKDGNYIRMFKIDKNHMENNGKIVAYKNYLIIGLIKSDVDYLDKPSLSSTLSLYTKSGKFIKDLGFFDEIYDKYCLINLLSISFSLDKENGAIYYVQQATYKVTKIDINDGKVAVFGFKGNNYKPFTQGVPKKMGISHEAVFKLFCSASSLQEIGLINNRYLIAQYENANVIRNNGKILYKACLFTHLTLPTKRIV